MTALVQLAALVLTWWALVGCTHTYVDLTPCPDAGCAENLDGECGDGGDVDRCGDQVDGNP